MFAHVIRRSTLSCSLAENLCSIIPSSSSCSTFNTISKSLLYLTNPKDLGENWKENWVVYDSIEKNPGKHWGNQSYLKVISKDMASPSSEKNIRVFSSIYNERISLLGRQSKESGAKSTLMHSILCAFLASELSKFWFLKCRGAKGFHAKMKEQINF